MTLRSDTIATCKASWYRPPDLNIWQWCEKHVDFSLAQNYDTPKHERFRADYMPFWNEPVECLTDPRVREVVILKCARAGGSENLLLNPIRYVVANAPQPTLYVTGDQISAERFMDKRIKRGFRACPPAWRLFKSAQHTQHDIAMPGCDVRVTWPKSKQAFKQDGWSLVLCDEVSLWPEYSTDMARKRTASYPFSHIVFLSSPDPQQKRSSDDDPIFAEYERGDQRRWTCKDPATGSEFVFCLGVRDGAGLQWDQTAKRDDGTWDMDKVRRTAWYRTPDGTRIENKQRMKVVRAGRWVASNPDAPSSVRSYHVTAFMTPFASGDFGEVAVAFLLAKQRGATAMRTFVYEFLAEKWAESIEVTRDEKLMEREADYPRRELITDRLPQYAGSVSSVIIGADVQKAHVWWVARQFVDGGSSGLIDYGTAATFEELDQIASKYGASRVFIDCNYRKLEVLEACYHFNFVPVEGHDKLSLPFLEKRIDPFEGAVGAGRATIALLQFESSVFKDLLMDCMRGESEKSWHVPRGIANEYVRQVCAEQKIDGEWQLRKGYTQNHLFDCETYALFGAVYTRFFRTTYLRAD